MKDKIKNLFVRLFKKQYLNLGYINKLNLRGIRVYQTLSFSFFYTMKTKTDKIANAFYNEDYKELEKLTGIKAESQKEFEELKDGLK